MDTPISGVKTMRELVQCKDWSQTALGPMANWPQSLSILVALCLDSRFPSVIFWGDDRVQIYNDGYREILGAKHPAALGQRAADCWAEIWHLIRDMMVSVFETGEAVWVESSQFSVERNGYLEEAYFTFSYTPAQSETGKVGGIFETVAEVTEQVISNRRLAALRELGELAAAQDSRDACTGAAAILANYAHDLPFLALYLTDEHTPVAHLAASAHLVAGSPAAPEQVALTAVDPWHLSDVMEPGSMQVLTDLSAIGVALPGGPWPESARTAVVMPLHAGTAERPAGFLIAGISPRRALDDTYRDFLRLIAQHLSRVLTGAAAYEYERRRAEQLMALDMAKTAFFNNVSHEFRTPLTLILGYLDRAREAGEGKLQGDALAAVSRSAERLLRLVNSLLDFARLESGRTSSCFAPTDLAVMTADFASTFRSAIERAGVSFLVECPPLPGPVYVDAVQWEKIVLNLISNAFKFTLSGAIRVALQWQGDHVELLVEDTGCGIPEHELPHMFERFHRVEGTQGRSFEGSGIGLALVREYVGLHGGEVSVSSELGRGSRFSVRIPTGHDHLPAEQVANQSSRGLASYGAHLLGEADTWLPEAPHGASGSDGHAVKPDAQAHGPRILVVDDNADMRAYIARILSAHWPVDLAEDGEVALQHVQSAMPELIVSDVMMPRLDGIGLLRALRDNPKTAQIPVILVSARAGEESVLEGIGTGADDYMVKPFSPRELEVRVNTHLQMAQRRRKWARELERVNAELESFSYSASHDLRAPLRAIDGFSRLLLTRAAHKLDESEQRHLNMVRAGAQQMSLLIDDLLALAHITRHPLHRTEIDLSELAARILSRMAGEEPQREVAMHVTLGMTIRADLKLVNLLLENLLGNAWKYTSRREKACIEVGMDRHDGVTTFFVKDNGAGFDMQYADKLFTPFQRLHESSEFPGTGVGLSIVQRVIARHDGRIWADAAPDRGACFHFSFGEDA